MDYLMEMGVDLWLMFYVMCMLFDEINVLDVGLMCELLLIIVLNV